MSKPHNGVIVNWFKHHFDTEQIRKEYQEDPGLGFLIRGRFLNHPYLSGVGHTSWIVKYEEQPDGSVEVETRNSRYTLKDRMKNV